MTETFDFDAMNRTVIGEFRATGGKAGGAFEGKPLVLVHHIGVKSGIERISPLVPLLDGRSSSWSGLAVQPPRANESCVGVG
jgi:hypothetical protein